MQIIGRRLPPRHSAGFSSEDHFRATVSPTDHRRNAAVAVETHTPVQQRFVDETGVGGITYVGYSACGVLPGELLWRIQKITEVGTLTTIQWALTPATGDTPDLYGEFDKEWDERASYVYG